VPLKDLPEVVFPALERNVQLPEDLSRAREMGS